MTILKYEKMEEIPEDLREHAVENKEGAGFVVNVGPKAVIKEFRENNQRLRNDLDEAKAVAEKLTAIVGEDADKFVEELDALRSTKQQVSDGKLQTKAEVEAEVQRRVESAKQALEAKLAEKEQTISVLEANISDRDKTILHTKLGDYIREQATEADAGVDMSAMEYLINDASKEFEYDSESNRFLRKVNGKVQLGEDGYTPQTGAEWIVSVKKTKPFFFQKSSGGNAGDSAGDKFGGYSREDFAKLSPEQKLEIANRM